MTKCIDEFGFYTECPNEDEKFLEDFNMNDEMEKISKEDPFSDWNNFLL
jgi:hypothetical protein